MGGCFYVWFFFELFCLRFEMFWFSFLSILFLKIFFCWFEVILFLLLFWEFLKCCVGDDVGLLMWCFLVVVVEGVVVMFCWVFEVLLKVFFCGNVVEGILDCFDEGVVCGRVSLDFSCMLRYGMVGYGSWVVFGLMGIERWLE